MDNPAIWLNPYWLLFNDLGSSTEDLLWENQSKQPDFTSFPQYDCVCKAEKDIEVETVDVENVAELPICT